MSAGPQLRISVLRKSPGGWFIQGRVDCTGIIITTGKYFSDRRDALVHAGELRTAFETLKPEDIHIVKENDK